MFSVPSTLRKDSECARIDFFKAILLNKSQGKMAFFFGYFLLSLQKKVTIGFDIFCPQKKVTIDFVRFFVVKSL